MQPEVLVQNAEATATSNPTYNYYLSSVYHSHHTYFALHRCTTATSGAGVAVSACMQVCGKHQWNRGVRSPPGSDSTRSFSQDIQKFSA